MKHRDPQIPRLEVVSGALLIILCLATRGALAAEPIQLVEQAQARRIKMIERVAPSVVCIFDANQQEGGSGVLIDADGSGLTNYHVVADMLRSRSGWGGLSNGKLYPLEVLGIDPTGDVAMFRLTGRDRFSHAPLGDSDKVAVGDFALAMGNPFALSENYSPTVTLGIVTGTHRYQWGVDGNLIYGDCIQVDAPINPGSSGGPLFNSSGKVIGINGRISVDTRGRFNVGFGYAITSNQIKRFIPALYAGLLARHGTLQATVEDRNGTGVVFREVREDGSAYRAGVRPGDRLVNLDGTAITTPNQYVSLLGTYPAGWHLLLELERAGERVDSIARLDPITPKLSEPYVVSREVNMRQVERVLRAFRRRVLGGDKAARPMRWKWRVVRENAPTPAGARRRPQQFEVTQLGDGPIRMRQRYEDGQAGGLIEFDEKQAVRGTPETGDAYELPAETQMVLGAIYILQRWMLAPVELVDLTGVMHMGGDSLIQVPTHLGVDASPRGGSRLLELIDWPVAGHAVARFAFDVDTSLIVRIDLRDVPSGVEATIDLSDYRDVGGVFWPCTMAVRGAGFAYRDSLSDWELVP